MCWKYRSWLNHLRWATVWLSLGLWIESAGNWEQQSTIKQNLSPYFVECTIHVISWNHAMKWKPFLDMFFLEITTLEKKHSCPQHYYSVWKNLADDNVVNENRFPHHCAWLTGIQQSSLVSPPTGLVMRTFDTGVASPFTVWIECWTNIGFIGNLWRHGTHVPLL